MARWERKARRDIKAWKSATTIVGATSIIKLARRGLKVPLWVRTMLQRRPVKVASVALANKIARTTWALLVRGGIYQVPAAMLKS